MAEIARGLVWFYSDEAYVLQVYCFEEVEVRKL